MGSWSEKLRFRVFHRRMYYDGFNAGLLVLLAVILLPAWKRFAGESSVEVGDFLASAALPAALGFLLAIRYGTVDLSVWVVMGLGGAVATGVLRACASPAGLVPFWAAPLSAGAAVLAGACAGGISALLLWKIRLPGFVITGAVGLAILLLLHVVCGESRSLTVPEETFDPWVSGMTAAFANLTRPDLQLEGPLILLRMIVVFFAWTTVLVVLMLADAKTRHAPRPFAQWWVRSASLCASGALASLAGVCWLIDQGRSPLPSRLVDGLTIPVAVILCGALLLRGPGRTMLAVIFLPVSMLLSDIWEQMVWPITIRGYSVCLVILGGVVLLAQAAYVWGLDHPRRGRWKSWTAAALEGLGLAMLAMSIWFPLSVQRTLILLALGTCLSGGVLLGYTVLHARRHPEQDDFDAYDEEDLEEEGL